jgi:signal transduction histidine kinase
VPKVYHEDRPSLEETSRAFFAETFPDMEYEGIQEVHFDPHNFEFGFALAPRMEQPFYYPAHFVEPLAENSLLVDFDINSLMHSRNLLEETLSSLQPSVSAPFRMFPGTTMMTDQNSVMLLHPGIPLSNHKDRIPEDVAMLLINSESIITRLTSAVAYQSVAIYLFDCSVAIDDHVFLIGADLSKDPSDKDQYYLPEIKMDDLMASSAGSWMETTYIAISSTTTWSIAVVSLDGEFESNSASTITAGVLMFVACSFVAFWIWWDMQRNRTMQTIRSQADAENAAIKLKSAQAQARAEQELNDYIAHEIRNPLAAAMSACSFVKSAVHESPPLRDKESEESVREDVDIIDASLTFMNDLLRSMLDMHKAESKRIDVNIAPADMRHDILDPVAAMLYKRDSSFDVLVECPENLIISTDRLRMKQCVLNLGRNSTKFVEKGFIKLVASVVNGTVRVVIEDSGLGIPESKRENLFNKFQESLDVMEQGTGMGLCLVKNMTQLLGGDIWLDESFNSGVPGCPGCRFVIETNLAPMSLDECHEALLRREKDHLAASIRTFTSAEDEAEAWVADHDDDEKDEGTELPEGLSVLFVDDDMVLRKLFARSIKKVVDTWKIQEAANGESALQIVKEQSFDIIFLDQVRIQRMSSSFCFIWS